MKSWTWVLLIGAALFVVLVYKHQTCPECQAKWNGWLMHIRNLFANKIAKREDTFTGDVDVN